MNTVGIPPPGVGADQKRPGSADPKPSPLRRQGRLVHGVELAAERADVRDLPRLDDKPGRTIRCLSRMYVVRLAYTSRSSLPIPRRLQLVRRGTVAASMLGTLEARVFVVVAEIPQLVRGQEASRADGSVTSLGATGGLSSSASMGRPVHRSLASVLYWAPPG